MASGLKRYHQEGHCHFVTFSCYRREPFLEEDRLRIVFEQTLERLRRRHGFYVFGYILMPEHVHLLISEPKKILLSRVIGALKTEVSKKGRDMRQQFWQARYFGFNVFTHKKFVEKLRYMHRNPVKRGLVGKPEDWPWSTLFATGSLAWKAALKSNQNGLGIRDIAPILKPTHDQVHVMGGAPGSGSKMDGTVLITYTPFFPFGGYITPPATNLEQQFTGKERDAEFSGAHW